VGAEPSFTGCVEVNLRVLPSPALSCHHGWVLLPAMFYCPTPLVDCFKNKTKQKKNQQTKNRPKKPSQNAQVFGFLPISFLLPAPRQRCERGGGGDSRQVGWVLLRAPCGDGANVSEWQKAKEEKIPQKQLTKLC